MTDAVRRFLYTPPKDRDGIKRWVQGFLDFDIHSTVRCKHVDPETGRPHQSQLDYVAGAVLGEYSSCVFMAARNAGKSYAAAIVDLLDCWFQPGIKIAVAAFQRNQSDYIYTYLLDFIQKFEARIGFKVAKISKDEIVFKNGSSVKFFSGGKSQAGIKGFHPNRLQVDEGDLFSQEQFDGIANALEAGGKFQRRFDVLSTNYTVSGEGVILKQIERYEQFNKTKNPHLLPCKIFRVCLLDILVKCDERFQCFDERTQTHCPLWTYCKGAAKQGDGFYKIESAFETQRDSSLPTFESQMLLLRPSSEYVYFGGFSHALNVADDLTYDPKRETFISFDFGGKRCPHSAVLVQRDLLSKPKEVTTYYAIDEFESWGNLENMISSIKAKYPMATDFQCFIDPAGNIRSQNAGAISYKTSLRNAGFFPREKQLKRKPTFELLNALIQPASGGTKLRMAKKCKNLIRQIEAAEFEVLRGRPTGEPADNGHDDLLDCLRYVVGWTCGTYCKHNGNKRLTYF